MSIRYINLQATVWSSYDGYANATSHEEHTKEMDEERKYLEKFISKYEALPGDITEIDQDEIDRICQRYEC